MQVACTDGVSGIFVSSEAAKDGSFQIFHLQGQARNGLMYFTFVPSDREENGGGAFLGSRDESIFDKSYVGVMYGVDKWKRDKTCVLHRFGAVIGPVSDIAKFPEFLKKKGKAFAEADGLAEETAVFALAPCRRGDEVG